MLKPKALWITTRGKWFWSHRIPMRNRKVWRTSGSRVARLHPDPHTRKHKTHRKAARTRAARNHRKMPINIAETRGRWSETALWSFHRRDPRESSEAILHIQLSSTADCDGTEPEPRLCAEMPSKKKKYNSRFPPVRPDTPSVERASGQS